MSAASRPAEVILVWLMPVPDDAAPSRISAGYHLGCGYLEAWLATLGVSSRQLLFERAPLDAVAQQIAESGARVLGLSIKDTNFFAARKLAGAVKRLNADLFIAFGGLTATFSEQLVLSECREASACVRSYGEFSFGQLVEAVLGGGDWRATPGISYLDEDGLVRNAPKAPPGPRPRNLDFLPSPYLEGRIPAVTAPVVGLSTSRGCIFRCSFCNPTAMAGFTIAYHSDDRVVAELRMIDEALERAAPGRRERRLMLLNEDIFALNVKRTQRLCGRIAAAGIRHLSFGCETRIEHLDRDTLQAMWDAGFRFLKFGLESGNPRVLNVIKKVRTKDGAGDNYAAERAFLAQVRDVVAIAKDIGFRVAAGAIFGLPGERLSDAIDTLDFLRRADVDEYYHNFLQLFAGTEIFERREEFGLQLETNPGYYPTIYRTHWSYSVALVPRLEERTSRVFKRNVVQL